MAVWDGRPDHRFGPGFGILVLRRLAPMMGSRIGAFASSGLRLFAEADFAMRDGIIDTLAKQTAE
jgi:hypothetical protein